MGHVDCWIERTARFPSPIAWSRMELPTMHPEVNATIRKRAMKILYPELPWARLSDAKIHKWTSSVARTNVTMTHSTHLFAVPGLASFLSNGKGKHNYEQNPSYVLSNFPLVWGSTSSQMLSRTMLFWTRRIAFEKHQSCLRRSASNRAKPTTAVMV